LRTRDPLASDPPSAWRRVDRWVLRTTEALACLVGATFTVMITLEVVSRYLFQFSIFFINSAARLLLVWFFLLGAGLALRQGAHVGLEILTGRLPPAPARALAVLAQLLAMLFFVLMAWSGWLALGPAARQVDSALGLSILWVMLAFPVGFLLLLYHQVVLLLETLRAGTPDSTP
jgi:TRAP-type C4-dicarboxylate transport system permease small subunit